MQQFRIVPATSPVQYGPRQHDFRCTCCGKVKKAFFRQYATATEHVCSTCAKTYTPQAILDLIHPTVK